MRPSAFVGAIAASACLWASAASATTILVSPLSFDFGDVFTGASAPQQTVKITNVTATTQSISLAGGGAGATFGGASSCGSSLAPGASCSISYRFKPTALGGATGTTTLFVNGEAHTIDFQGNGVNPFMVTPTSFNFGTVAPGSTSSQQTVLITNVSGAMQSLSLAGGGAGATFGGVSSCGSTLAPGASCGISYKFSPTGTGSATGTTTLFINGAPYTFSFGGTGGTVSASPFLVTPLAFDFGGVYTGAASPQQTVTITNVSDVKTPQSLSLAGGGAGATFGGASSCGSSLAAGASCGISYRFRPTDLGDATGTTTLFVNGVPYTFGFQGVGLDPILVSALSFDFGDIDVGTTSPFQSVDILNVSDVLQDLSLAGGGAGVFGGVSGCGSSLAADASCKISYRFSPTAPGPVTGTTTLIVNGIAKTITFTGVGIGPDGGSDGGPGVDVLPAPAPLTVLSSGLFMMAVFRRRARART